MAMTCNIDRTGRRLRLIMGLVGVGLSIPLFFVHWLIGLLVLAGGAFAIFEASIGWCAARAMGFKTRV